MSRALWIGLITTAARRPARAEPAKSQLNADVPSGERPWPDVRLGAHSTRIGAAHDLAAAGIDLTSIMHSGGWNDPKMPRYYTRELAAKDSGMARMARARSAHHSQDV